MPVRAQAAMTAIATSRTSRPNDPYNFKNDRERLYALGNHLAAPQQGAKESSTDNTLFTGCNRQEADFRFISGCVGGQMGSDIDYALGTDFGERFEPNKVIDAAIAFANGDVFPSAESRSYRSGHPYLNFDQAEDSKAYATEILI
jgi:hypothetical protein